MSMPVRIDPALYALARTEAGIEHRTIAGQIEYWALVGRTALDNPELPIYFIVDLLASLAEPDSYKTPFVRREVGDNIKETP